MNFYPYFRFSLSRHRPRFMKVCNFILIRPCLTEILPALFLSSVKGFLTECVNIYLSPLLTRLLLLFFVESILCYCEILPSLSLNLIFVLSSWTQNSAVSVFVVNFLPLLETKRILLVKIRCFLILAPKIIVRCACLYCFCSVSDTIRTLLLIIWLYNLIFLHVQKPLSIMSARLLLNYYLLVSSSTDRFTSAKSLLLVFVSLT